MVAGAWPRLDAGADRVVGIDSSWDAIKQAEENFRDYGVEPGAYQLIHSDIFAALRQMKREEFDLILCQRYCEFSDARVPVQPFQSAVAAARNSRHRYFARRRSGAALHV